MAWLLITLPSDASVVFTSTAEASTAIVVLVSPTFSKTTFKVPGWFTWSSMPLTTSSAKPGACAVSV